MVDKIKTKDNIIGKINDGNKNYENSDLDNLEELFPEEKGSKIIGIKQNRDRISALADIPDTLPTAGLFPYPIDETDHIGQFELKKNLYLVFAHAFNKAMNRIKVLEQEIQELKNKP